MNEEKKIKVSWVYGFGGSVEEMEVEKELGEIWKEYISACGKYKKFNSRHEGFAVLLEEVDELWESIKKRERVEGVRGEAVQVGAMALRFLVECCGGELGGVK